MDFEAGTATSCRTCTATGSRETNIEFVPVTHGIYTVDSKRA
ncbi:MAG: hypothetical protein ACLR23_19795 [Clostridia bacterium]